MASENLQKLTRALEDGEKAAAQNPAPEVAPSWETHAVGLADWERAAVAVQGGYVTGQPVTAEEFAQTVAAVRNGVVS